MSAYESFIGIDYSGAQTPTSRLKSLQVYVAKPNHAPRRQTGPGRRVDATPANWTRREVAEWLIQLAEDGQPFIAGIDHGFSFPKSYFDRNGITTWDGFLGDFVRHWPTDRDHVYVDFIRDGSIAGAPGMQDWPGPGKRNGSPTEMRLCERWTSSAKSVFQFDVQGQVAKSTHAGIPWLRRIREATRSAVHFWPFDGWVPPPGKSVIAEVYPSIFRNRYSREDRSADEHDAWAVAHWLANTSTRGFLARYFEPPLTLPERRQAEVEGWILGVM